MATAKKAEVATAKQSAQLPMEMDMEMLLQDSGAGVDSMGMDDIAVPYLYVLQTNSPQVNPDHDSYIDGATAGMFFNNVSMEVYDGRKEGLTIIPCAYDRKYVEWVSRDEGGGYVAEHEIDSGILNETTPNEKGVPILGNGHLIVETAYHYVYFKNPNDGQWDQIILPMKSTFLKKSRRWNKTLMSTLIPGTASRAPRWLYPYQIKTVKEEKNGNVWSNLDITRLEAPVNKEQYLSAKAFADVMAQGLIVKARESDVGGAGGDGEAGSDARSNRNGKPDEEMPF